MAPKKAVAKAETVAKGAKVATASKGKGKAKAKKSEDEGESGLPRGCVIGATAAFHAMRASEPGDISEFYDAMYEYTQKGGNGESREEFDEWMVDEPGGGDLYTSFCEDAAETDPKFKVGDLVLLEQDYESRWYYGMHQVSWDVKRGKKCLQNVSGECGNPALPSFIAQFIKAHRGKDFTTRATAAMYEFVGEEYHGEGDEGDEGEDEDDDGGGHY